MYTLSIRWLALVLIVMYSQAYAGEVARENIIQFQKGATAVADDVNSNFEKLRQAINDSSLKIKSSIARSICYSALSGTTDHSLILIPLENNTVSLDGKCSAAINKDWHAGGIAKGAYINQDCTEIDNLISGGGYTSFVSKVTFEANRETYNSCNANNSFICCSPQF